MSEAMERVAVEALRRTNDGALKWRRTDRASFVVSVDHAVIVLEHDGSLSLRNEQDRRVGDHYVSDTTRTLVDVVSGKWGDRDSLAEKVHTALVNMEPF